jgi:hypothetical protein
VGSDTDIDPLATLILTPSGGGSKGLERDVLGSPIQQVPVEAEVILAIRALADCGVGSKANRPITGHLRCFSDQPVAEIVQCGEPHP